jgi:phage terminase large subunit
VLFIDYECGGIGIDIDKTAAELNKIPTLATWASRADNARPELISHMQSNGFPRMRSCKKGKGSVEDGIAKIRGFREVVIHPRCTNTIMEFKLYKWKTNSTNGDIMPIPEDKNNHGIDALRYALEGYERQTYSVARW